MVSVHNLAFSDILWHSSTFERLLILYVLRRAWRQRGKFIQWNSWRDSFLWYYRPSSWLVFPLNKSVVWAVIILPDGALSDVLASTWNIKSNVNLGEPFCAWIPGGYLPLYEFTIPFVHGQSLYFGLLPFFHLCPFIWDLNWGLIFSISMIGIWGCFEWHPCISSDLILVISSARNRTRISWGCEFESDCQFHASLNANGSTMLIHIGYFSEPICVTNCISL